MNLLHILIMALMAAAVASKHHSHGPHHCHNHHNRHHCQQNVQNVQCGFGHYEETNLGGGGQYDGGLQAGDIKDTYDTIPDFDAYLSKNTSPSLF